MSFNQTNNEILRSLGLNERQDNVLKLTDVLSHIRLKIFSILI